MTMTREQLADWVGREILPHERDLRVWLLRRVSRPSDAADIVQECYCRLAQLSNVDQIEKPRAYLFTIARNLLHRQIRAARIVPIVAISEIENDWTSDEPLPDRVVIARQELLRVQAALATLTNRARRIFIMRRVDGLSQKEIAEELNVSEAVVENDASRSLRAVLRLLTEAEPPAAERPKRLGGGGRVRPH